MRVLILVILLWPSLTYSQSDYTFWFEKAGVKIYYKWSCSNCYDRHIRVKMENTNSYEITWKHDGIVWKSNGQQVGSEIGASWFLKPYASAAGDYSGNFLYPPQGYKNDPQLTMHFTNFRVENTNQQALNNSSIQNNGNNSVQSQTNYSANQNNQEEQQLQQEEQRKRQEEELRKQEELIRQEREAETNTLNQQTQTYLQNSNDPNKGKIEQTMNLTFAQLNNSYLLQKGLGNQDQLLQQRTQIEQMQNSVRQEAYTEIGNGISTLVGTLMANSERKYERREAEKKDNESRYFHDTGVILKEGFQLINNDLAAINQQTTLKEALKKFFDANSVYLTLFEQCDETPKYYSALDQEKALGALEKRKVIENYNWKIEKIYFDHKDYRKVRNDCCGEPNKFYFEGVHQRVEGNQKKAVTNFRALEAFDLVTYANSSKFNAEKLYWTKYDDYGSNSVQTGLLYLKQIQAVAYIGEMYMDSIQTKKNGKYIKLAVNQFEKALSLAKTKTSIKVDYKLVASATNKLTNKPVIYYDRLEYYITVSQIYAKLLSCVYLISDLPDNEMITASDKITAVNNAMEFFKYFYQR
jgi:hypothetical protein